MSAPVGRTPESRPLGAGLEPYYSLRLGEWLSGSSQAHSAARCLVSPPQEARIASRGTRTGRALPTCCGTILLQVHEQHRAEQRRREDRHQVQHLDGNDEALRHRRPRRRLGQAPRLRAGPEAAVALPCRPGGQACAEASAPRVAGGQRCRWRHGACWPCWRQAPCWRTPTSFEKQKSIAVASATSAAVARSAVCLYCQGWGEVCKHVGGQGGRAWHGCSAHDTGLRGGERVQRAAERGEQHEAQHAQARQREDVRCRGQPRREQHAREDGRVERERPLQPRRVVRGVRIVVRDEVAQKEAAG